MAEKYGLLTTKDAFSFRIKWPNDIYALCGEPQKLLKVGGILCNSMSCGQQFSVIVGIGLNISNKEPTTCVNDIITAALHARGRTSAQPLNRETLLATTMKHFEEFQSVRYCCDCRIHTKCSHVSTSSFSPFKSLNATLSRLLTCLWSKADFHCRYWSKWDLMHWSLLTEDTGFMKTKDSWLEIHRCEACQRTRFSGCTGSVPVLPR